MLREIEKVKHFIMFKRIILKPQKPSVANALGCAENVH